jgi:V/A-type H+-transporting ATPase subunit A
MTLLQEEASLNEIVKMVGMDALSPADRLKMEAARSIREDFLHQNSFDDIDTYTSINKQYRMMQLVYAFYEEGQKALSRGAKIDDLVKLPIREDIGRFKYTVEENVESQFEKVSADLVRAIAGLSGKED